MKQKTSAGASGLEWTSHDLSTFTKTDANSMEDGTTSLGVSSSVVVNPITGESDSGLDSLTYNKVIQAAIPWGDYRSLEIEVTVTPPATGGGANAYMLVGICKATGGLVTQEGYLAGLRVLAAGGHRLIAKRIGANPDPGPAPNLAGEVAVMISLPFEASQPAEIVATADDGSNIHHQSDTLTVAGGPWTDLTLCLSFEKDAAGSGDITWTVASVKTALITRAG